MSPNTTGPTDHRHHRYLNGATLLSAAWQVGPFFCVGKATVTLPSGKQRVGLLTAAGTSLDHVHELLIRKAGHFDVKR